MATVISASSCGGGAVPASNPRSEAVSISLSPIGHWHVYHSKKLVLSVTDARGKGVPSLELQVQVVATKGARTERGTKDGSIHDDGDGRYSFELSPSEVGSYALVARAVLPGADGLSSPVAFEVVRDGEEGIRTDAAGTSFVYQIRYAWAPGEPHAADGEKTTLTFEVMRGIPRGAEIDWVKPWQNRFDHVEAARDPIVVIESGDVREQLPATYRGLGVYQVERAFPAAEVGAQGRDYHVRFSFVDPLHGAQVTHKESYLLHVAP